MTAFRNAVINFLYLVQNKTTLQATKFLWRIFNIFGLPNILRSDGARCFTYQFDEWCESLSISHQTSSAYNSPSNGSTERAVRTVKDMFNKDGLSMGEKLIELMIILNRNSAIYGSGSPS